MKERTEEYYGWYPEDKDLAVRICEHLAKNEEYLPTGERLTPHRFQMLGNILGGNGRARGLHYVLESALLSLISGSLTSSWRLWASRSASRLAPSTACYMRRFMRTAPRRSWGNLAVRFTDELVCNPHVRGARTLPRTPLPCC